ncbi:hypothetical protein [Glycomyces harbinensis]|uniref:Uncharacterized protein n=1 Tax=Glycomyces harbinensis TaxID=58114 RepID=A0A1G6V9K5_9ACTN|nr:hypothetical protein [Glycomyces harbinensis]SDD49506.1 hypothetical protein SAMN05216270_104252 [Glycomyces harbinensis]
MTEEMPENWYDASRPTALKFRSFPGFIDHLNRLESQAKQLAGEIQVVRNYAKDFAWGLTEVVEDAAAIEENRAKGSE